MIKTKKNFDKLTKQTLDFVNLHRHKRKLPLLKTLRKGFRESCNDCPVARSLSEGTESYEVYRTLFRLGSEGLCKSLPPVVKEWITAFDNKYSCEGFDDVLVEFRETPERETV